MISVESAEIFYYYISPYFSSVINSDLSVTPRGGSSGEGLGLAGMFSSDLKFGPLGQTISGGYVPLVKS